MYAASQLQSHLRVLEEGVVRKHLSQDQLREIERVVSSLPEDGFDWARRSTSNWAASWDSKSAC